MDQLLDILSDERVTIASVDKNRFGTNDSLDKEAVKKSVELKKRVIDTANFLAEKTVEERRQWVEETKGKADALYKDQKYGEAMQIYLDALMGLNEDQLGKETVQDVKIKICCNLAMCAVETHHTNQAIDFIKQAIKLNPDSWRSHFKKAIIQERAEMFDQAL